MRSHMDRPRSALDALADLEGAPARPAVCATGFTPLDGLIGGGVGPGDFVLIGGKPGAGKTIVALQWARAVAMAGHTAVYACYEHDTALLVTRLLAAELGELLGQRALDDAVYVESLRGALRGAASGNVALGPLIEAHDLLWSAAAAMRSYAARLVLLKASGTRTDIEELASVTSAAAKSSPGRTVLFVDYIQKVPVHPEPADEVERVKRVAEAVKDLALSEGVAVVGIVAADQVGLSSRRLHLHHFRGSTALAYEPDVVLVLNNKFDIVSKVHLAYDTTRADEFRQKVVFSIEKNRNGPTDADLEFRTDFANCRFDPHGSWVAERLWAEGANEE